MKLLTAAILLALTTAAQAFPAHCQERRQRDRMQMRCMVDLTQMPDGKFKRWCLKQSERMP